MTSYARKMVDELLQMSPQDRAAVAEELIASLDEEPDNGVEEEWQKEIEKRVLEIKKARVTCLPWETVYNRLKG